MRQIDKNLKEKRDKKYNDWARSYPTYLFIVIFIVLGIITEADV